MTETNLIERKLCEYLQGNWCWLSFFPVKRNGVPTGNSLLGHLNQWFRTGLSQSCDLRVVHSAPPSARNHYLYIQSQRSGRGSELPLSIKTFIMHDPPGLHIYPWSRLLRQHLFYIAHFSISHVVFWLGIGLLDLANFLFPSAFPSAPCQRHP